MDRRVHSLLLSLATLSMLVAGAGSAAASHWSIHYSAADQYAGETLEDDGAVFFDPNTPIDGRANRVVYPGNSPGDGSLFIDARVGNNGFTPGTLYPGAFTRAARGHDDFLLPGYSTVAAWYGYWRDADNDGVIDDVHDAACGATLCIDDEFMWRGRATDEPVAVEFYYVKPDDGNFIRASLVDNTDPSNGAQQEWSGGNYYSQYGGFIGDFKTLTLAGAPSAPGTALAFDIDSPAALYDVDIYDSVDPDVATLFFASRDAAAGVRASVLELAADALAILELAPDALAIVAEQRAELDNTTKPITSDAIGFTFGATFGAVATADQATYAATDPPTGKEPTTVWDDYEGRALFGGIGDARGSFNTYDGYASEHHFYFDNVAVERTVCAGVYARVPTTAITTSTAAACTGPLDRDPVGANGPGSRTAGTLLGFAGHAFLWRDINRDTHVGAKCDPTEPGEFDAEHNTCNIPPRGWPHDENSNEVRANVCDTTTAKGGRITLTPLDGPWRNVVIVRDMRETTRYAFDEHWEVRADTAPIVLRFRDDCSERIVESRDGVLFPEGRSRGAIRVETEAIIHGFVDGATGVSIGRERVLDVDVIPGAF